MGEAELGFVDAQTFTVNLPGLSHPVAIRAEGNEVVIVMRLTLSPRNNVVNLDYDVSASGDGAAVPCLYENTPFDIGRYCGSIPHSHKAT